MGHLTRPRNNLPRTVNPRESASPSCLAGKIIIIFLCCCLDTVREDSFWPPIQPGPGATSPELSHGCMLASPPVLYLAPGPAQWKVIRKAAKNETKKSRWALLARADEPNVLRLLLPKQRCSHVLVLYCGCGVSSDEPTPREAIRAVCACVCNRDVFSSKSPFFLETPIHQRARLFHHEAFERARGRHSGFNTKAPFGSLTD